MIACPNEIGITSLRTQDDIVIAIAIITIAPAAFLTLSMGKSSFAIFSKATDIKTIASDSPITDKKSIFPTSLNAKPIANTATAIINIVPTPFFISFSTFLSPPISSIGLLLLLLESSNIVFWFLRISLVSDLIDFIPASIAFNCFEKSPLCNTLVVVVLLLPFLPRVSAIITNASDKLSSAFNNCLSIIVYIKKLNPLR